MCRSEDLRVRRRRPEWTVAIGVATLGLIAMPARAQEPPLEPPVAEDLRLPGAHREPTRLFLGMWTTHLKHHVIAIDSNWLVGVTHRSYFFATFRNSFGRQAFTAGMQRTLVSRRRGRLASSLGGRVGLVYGYDGRFIRLARDVPVLPMIQGFGNVDVGRVGIEVSYTFVVVSVTTSYRF
jgi:hypothetical protein